MTHLKRVIELAERGRGTTRPNPVVEAVVVAGGEVVGRLDARDVAAEGQPRWIAFGRGPLPEGSELELLSGPLEDELRGLGEQGVQSLFLEGGPMTATAFLERDLVDRLLVFVAPTMAGDGRRMLDALPGAIPLHHLSAEPVGDDVLLDACVHEP